MSRRIGAFVTFDEKALQRLVDIPQEMIDRVEDMSPVMAVVATDDLKPEMLENLASQGQGSWAPKDPDTIKRHGNTPLGVGAHGGFAPTVQRSWSKSNAVAFTRAPHAHLFEGGTKRYRTASGAANPRWNINGRHRSRAFSRAHRLNPSALSSQHQPPRAFAYIGDPVKERASRRIAAFIVEESYRGAV
jgi:hypothetical protein